MQNSSWSTLGHWARLSSLWLSSTEGPDCAWLCTTGWGHVETDGVLHWSEERHMSGNLILIHSLPFCGPSCYSHLQLKQSVQVWVRYIDKRLWPILGLLHHQQAYHFGPSPICYDITVHEHLQPSAPVGWACWPNKIFLMSCDTVMRKL